MIFLKKIRGGYNNKQIQNINTKTLEGECDFFSLIFSRLAIFVTDTALLVYLRKSFFKISGLRISGLRYF